MRRTLACLASILLVLVVASCGNDATQPAPASNADGTVHGKIGTADFEFEINAGAPGDPMEGPFVLRGTNLHYDDEDGALVVDLTIRNRGTYPHPEPIGLTFLKLDPDEVTVLNPDNDEHGDGAAILFHFANDDGIWTPGEESLPRTVEFGVSPGVAIAFVARLDIPTLPENGVIDGRVWNDANQNGIMDDNEAGIGNFRVYLRSFAATSDSTVTGPIFTTVTDQTGHYAFPHLMAGGYVVSVAPSTVGFFPTTPTEIHVLLTETNGDVSSYHGANFGGIPAVLPPPPGIGEHIHAAGKFSPPDAFAAADVKHLDCPDDTIPSPYGMIPDPECMGGRLRGTVTEAAPERNAFRVMATWVLADPSMVPPDMHVGMRLDVHVHVAPGPVAGWVADSIGPWAGDHDEIVGRVDAIISDPNDYPRLRVLDTWVIVPRPNTNG